MNLRQNLGEQTKPKRVSGCTSSGNCKSTLGCKRRLHIYERNREPVFYGSVAKCRNIRAIRSGIKNRSPAPITERGCSSINQSRGIGTLRGPTAAAASWLRRSPWARIEGLRGPTGPDTHCMHPPPHTPHTGLTLPSAGSGLNACAAPPSLCRPPLPSHHLRGDEAAAAAKAADHRGVLAIGVACVARCRCRSRCGSTGRDGGQRWQRHRAAHAGGMNPHRRLLGER